MFLNVINKNSEEWESFGEKKSYSNKLNDVNKNISKAKNEDDLYDSMVSDNIIDSDFKSLYNLNIPNYHQRLYFYHIMAKYPEINRAISNHTNEIFNFDENNSFIHFSFTQMGESNIPENIKSDLQLRFHNLLNTVYSFTKLKADLKRYFIEGALLYEMNLDDNNNGVSSIRRIENGTYKTFTWNNEIKFFIEFADIESLSSEEIQGQESMVKSFLRQKVNDKLLSSESYNLTPTIKIIPKDKCLYLSWYENESVDTDDTISFLDNIAPVYNRLATVESHLVGYRVSRSLTSYAINLDLGDMPFKQKQKELQKYMDSYDTETVYDAVNDSTTNIKDVQTFTRMYWFTKGGEFDKSEVEPIDFNADFNDISDIKYFERKLLKMLKVPTYRWNGGIERSESDVRQTSMDKSGIAYEELEYQNFLDNTRNDLVENFFIPLFQTDINFSNINKEHIINKNNFNIYFKNDNLYKLYIQKSKYENKKELFEMLENIYPVEKLYKDILDIPQSEFTELIKSKLDGSDDKLKKLLSGEDEELSDEDKEELRKHYITGDDDYNQTIKRENVNFNNLTLDYKNKQNKLNLISLVKYFKTIIENHEEETDKNYNLVTNNLVKENG